MSLNIKGVDDLMFKEEHFAIYHDNAVSGWLDIPSAYSLVVLLSPEQQEVRPTCVNNDNGQIPL